MARSSDQGMATEGQADLDRADLLLVRLAQQAEEVTRGGRKVTDEEGTELTLLALQLSMGKELTAWTGYSTASRRTDSSLTSSLDTCKSHVVLPGGKGW